MANDTSAARVAQAFVRGELTALRGLPRVCRVPDLGPVLRSTGRGAVGWLGEPAYGQQVRPYQLLRADGFSDLPRAWLDGEQVILLDVDEPALAASPAGLGPPDTRLDYPWDVFVLPDAEWVYASRGLSIAVNPDNGIVLRIAVFAPTTVDTYRRTLRLVHEHHEEPDE